MNVQEEKLFEKKSDKDFNLHLLRTKKLLTKRYSYYSQLLDIAEAVCENSNGIFAETNLNYVDNAAKRLARLREDTAGLKNTVELSPLTPFFSAQFHEFFGCIFQLLFIDCLKVFRIAEESALAFLDFPQMKSASGNSRSVL